jgi:hypothetical protein
MISEVFLQITVRHVFSRCLPALGAHGPSPLGTGEITLNQPEEAKTSRNSFARNILQGTPLF